MNISSQWKETGKSAGEVYAFVSDLRNMNGLMPEQVSNWQAEKDRCSFDIKGMASFNLKLDEQVPGKRIRLIPDGKSPFGFELILHLREKTEMNSEAMVEITADLNPMMAMMVKNPLQNIVNIIAGKLSAHFG
ncbi:MAG: hypothetical protein H3C41_06595 [Bacteroidales bacterium]|nr:hypothetical protein [Bacteroidales bacterium]